MAKKKETWMMRAIRLNDKRCKQYYAEFKAKGAKWMVECRDLWDSEDDDAGVYFVDCASEKAVTKTVLEMKKRETDKVLGIYDLSKPLVEQGPGITAMEWLLTHR